MNATMLSARCTACFASLVSDDTERCRDCSAAYIVARDLAHAIAYAYREARLAIARARFEVTAHMRAIYKERVAECRRAASKLRARRAALLTAIRERCASNEEDIEDDTHADGDDVFAPLRNVVGAS